MQKVVFTTPKWRVREDGRQVAIDFVDDLDQIWMLKGNGFGFLKVHASPSLRCWARGN
jgi:hypothetical protein